MTIVFDILRWAIAVASVAGTLALLIWIVVVFLKKDPHNDVTGNRD